MSKVKVSGTIKVKVNAFGIVAEAVEAGVKYGLNRAYKHTDKPTREVMEEAVSHAVLNELCEVLMFDDRVDGV